MISNYQTRLLFQVCKSSLEKHSETYFCKDYIISGYIYIYIRVLIPANKRNCVGKELLVLLVVVLFHLAECTEIEVHGVADGNKRFN